MPTNRPARQLAKRLLSLSRVKIVVRLLRCDPCIRAMLLTQAGVVVRKDHSDQDYHLIFLRHSYLMLSTLWIARALTV